MHKAAAFDAATGLTAGHPCHDAAAARQPPERDTVAAPLPVCVALGGTQTIGGGDVTIAAPAIALFCKWKQSQQGFLPHHGEEGGGSFDSRRLATAASALRILRGYEASAAAAPVGRVGSALARPCNDRERSLRCAADLQLFFAPPPPSASSCTTDLSDGPTSGLSHPLIALFLQSLKRSGRFSIAELAMWLLDVFTNSADVKWRGAQHWAAVWSGASAAVRGLQCLLSTDISQTSADEHSKMAGAVVKAVLQRIFLFAANAATGASPCPLLPAGEKSRHDEAVNSAQHPHHHCREHVSAQSTCTAGSANRNDSTACARRTKRRLLDAHLALLLVLGTGIRVGSFVAQATEREVLALEHLSPAQSVVLSHVLRA